MLKIRQSNLYSKRFSKFIIVYELDTLSQDLNANFSLRDCLFGALALNKKAEPDKYSYSRCCTGLDSCSIFHFQVLIGVKYYYF